jgi:hypothetical protein
MTMLAVGCADSGSAVPSDAPPMAAMADSVSTFCAVALTEPEAFTVTLDADDVRGIDCIPPAGGEVFSLGFAHAGWWLQLDIARATLSPGTPHPFDSQAALLALDCWDWDGAVTVDEDDAAGWSLTFDAHCRKDATKSIVGVFSGEH